MREKRKKIIYTLKSWRQQRDYGKITLASVIQWHKPKQCVKWKKRKERDEMGTIVISQILLSITSKCEVKDNEQMDILYENFICV